VHVGIGPHVHRSLQAIRALGKKAGVTLNPGTPIETIENVIDLVDLILVMSVNPGFGGQAFIPARSTRSRAVRAGGGAADRHRDRRRRHAGQRRGGRARRRQRAGRGLGRVQGRPSTPIAPTSRRSAMPPRWRAGSRVNAASVARIPAIPRPNPTSHPPNDRPRDAHAADAARRAGRCEAQGRVSDASTTS
jgi:hypothetical protein